MLVKFTRTPPQEYSAYVEGEEAELNDKDARYLIGLGVATQPRRRTDSDTRMDSSRTEIVGRGNETEVVVRGRGANIAEVSSPDPEKAAADSAGKSDMPEITEEERRAASRAEAEGLVKQEAGRTGGFVDSTTTDDRSKLKGGGDAGKTNTASKPAAKDSK